MHLMKSSRVRLTVASSIALAAICAGEAIADVVVPDDQIVQGGQCVGLDCVNGQDFLFKTLVLKENNVRIFFDDTSGAGFPANDWQITLNDSSSGGANFFGIDDMTSSRRLMTLSAGASADSIFLSSSSRVGFGTAAPVLHLHVNKSDTPGLRFEQNNSGGFSAQTWDVAGNEANFFIRDVTGGSRLPFRIRPGAPTSSIDINAAGNVGVGTPTPGAKLHVMRDGNVSVRITSSAGASPGDWNIQTTGDTGHLRFIDVGAGTVPVTIEKGAPSNQLVVTAAGQIGVGTASPSHKMHVVGAVRLASLPNCTNGIRTNATGVLSCIPAPAVPGMASRSGVALAALGVAGSSAAAGGAGYSASDGASGTGKTSEGAAEATCDAGAVAGSWNVLGTNIEAIGAGSALWCDANFTPVSGQAGKFAITGACRGHSATEKAADVYELGGEGSVENNSRCSLAGRLQIKQPNGTTTVATIVEGSVESANGLRTRAVAVSRWSKGRTSTLQTLTLQR